MKIFPLLALCGLGFSAQPLLLDRPDWHWQVFALDLGTSLQKKRSPEEKQARVASFKRQFRRSDIIFFISLPFTWLINRFIIAPETDYISNAIVSVRARSAVGVEPLAFGEGTFDSNLFFVWVNSILWSTTISLNDAYENVAMPRRGTTKESFLYDQVAFNFYQVRF